MIEKVKENAVRLEFKLTAICFADFSFTIRPRTFSGVRKPNSNQKKHKKIITFHKPDWVRGRNTKRQSIDTSIEHGATIKGKHCRLDF